MQPELYCYYYGRLQREEIEPILRKRGCDDGLFLLRQHLYDPKVYVLSICYQKQIHHYKFEIRKNCLYLGNSPDFSGPIELIEYLKKNQNGLITKPLIECSRFLNTEPIYYLFINTEDYNFLIEKEIKKKSKSDEVKKTYLRHKYEKSAIKTLHLSQRWYHKNTKRTLAEALFKENGFYNGKFLLRSNRLSKYKLCLCYENIIYHYVIVYNDRRYSLQDSVGEEFDTLVHLIDYYGRRQGFLKCKLSMPYYINLSLCQKYICDTNEYYNSFINDNEQLLYQIRSIKNETISYSNICLNIPSTEFLDKIAEGSNSKIFKALCQPQGSTKKNEVAIKIIKDKTNNLIDEYKLLSKLDHLNIVKIIEPNGCYFNDDFKNSVIIFEFAKFRSLDYYLRENFNKNLKQNILIKILSQVASALVYLTTNNIVHRDIAARNVLMFSEDYAKLSDFGLSRYIDKDSSFYYSTIEEQLWPVKWYPPEVFKYRKFNEQSDVWSFGVLIWEIFTNCDVPYGAINIHTMDEVKIFFNSVEQKKLKLKKIDKFPNEINNLMNLCLEIDPNLRPKFFDILCILNIELDKNLPDNEISKL